MKVSEITEFGNFVSFVLDEGDRRICAQYRVEQVWRDEKNVWHIGKDQRPFHVTRTRVDRQPEPEISPELGDALKAAGKIQD